MNNSTKHFNNPSSQNPLGIYAKLRTPPKVYLDKFTGEYAQSGAVEESELINQSRRLRFSLQDSAREILYSYHQDGVPKDTKGREKHHRTCNCNRAMVSPTVQLVKSDSRKKSFFSGLATCANARTCPVCASVINERKSSEMRQAANLREELGYKFTMLTLTAPHTAGDKIEDLTNSVNAALQGFWRGAPAKRFKEQFGIVGHIRSFEVRHGRNGWHPHFHIIIVSRTALPRGKGRTYKWILDRWQNMCLRSGLSMPNEYGVDVQDGTKAGEYITKFGSNDEVLQTRSGQKITWDMADELTKGNAKLSGSGSMSPFQILDEYKLAETDKDKHYYKNLYLDYARAMAGVTLIKWSRGLRDIFDLGRELTDEEIIAEENDKADLIAHVTPVEWKVVTAKKLRSTLLEVCENGGSKAVAKMLFGLTAAGEFEAYYHQFKLRNKNYTNSLDSEKSRVKLTPDKTFLEVERVIY